MKWLQGCVFFYMVLLATPAIALDGWNITDTQTLRIYKPDDLPKGKVFAFLVPGPFELNGAELKTWVAANAKSMQESLGKPLREWSVKPDGDTWYVNNTYIDGNTGKQLIVNYIGGMLDRHRAYFITTISSMDSAIVEKYKNAFFQVQSDVIQHLTNKSSLSLSGKRSGDQQTDPAKTTSKEKTKSRSEQIREAVRVAPGKGADLADIDSIWVHSRMDLIWGGIRVHTYVLFEDGTVYRDCFIPPDELDVAASKRLEPEKWSTWRKSWGTYQIKNRKKNEWVDLKGSRGSRVPQGTELTGKYMTGGGSEYRGAWRDNITFLEGGRFELSSFFMGSNSMTGGGDPTDKALDRQPTPLLTGMVSSDKHGSSSATSFAGDYVGGGTSSVKKDGAKNRGSYEIHGYTVTLRHDNGREHTELILYEKEDRGKSIVYGDDVYVPAD